MKIVHIITRLILGGAQENTLLTCLEQSRLGHDVVLLTGPPHGREGSLLDEAAAMPFRTVLVPAMQRAVHPYRDLVAYWDLLKHLRDERGDVVHTHSSKAGFLGRRASRAAGSPCIVHTIHGLPFDAYQGRLAHRVYRTAERRAAGWSHRLIAVCSAMADRAAAADLAPRDQIDVVYSAMDTGRFRAAEGERERVRAGWGVGSAAFVFVKIARLFRLKGHEFVLPAFAQVAQDCPHATLVLAGDGVLRRDLERRARGLGIADRVRFLGLVARGAVPGLLWAADAVVHASLREGLARVLPYARLCRRPAVTYDIGGAREVIRDGENGFLLPQPAPGEAASSVARPLAEAMARLASDPGVARQMGERRCEEVLSRFDYRRATAEIMRVYQVARRVQAR